MGNNPYNIWHLVTCFDLFLAWMAANFQLSVTLWSLAFKKLIHSVHYTFQNLWEKYKLDMDRKKWASNLKWCSLSILSLSYLAMAAHFSAHGLKDQKQTRRDAASCIYLLLKKKGYCLKLVYWLISEVVITISIDKLL